MARRKSPLQQIMGNIPKPLRSRYTLVILVFLVWILFFDTYDVLTQWRLSKTKTKLIEEKAYYEREIKQTREDKLDLERNVEKFAREKYHMKRADEDVFVIVEEEEE
ncbi:MAG: hypothetical protein AAF849_19875 [Bacteroidota bacterium]